jgi:succinate dehydrogenase / fumarate reductase cytochrome b subunit
MIRPRAIYQSTVGKKVIMAVTGLILVAFLFGHVLGNLLAFSGPEALNGYAALLRREMGLLWIARLVLLAAVLLHIWSAYALTRVAYAARPAGYAKKVPQRATIASRTMRVGGLVILAFVIFHILHFTTGTIQPVPFAEHDVYSNVVRGLAVPWVAAIYIVAMLAIGLHLFHGTWASFRTLGVTRPSQSPFHRRAALAFAVLVWGGFTLIPVAVLAGVLR